MNIDRRHLIAVALGATLSKGAIAANKTEVGEVTDVRGEAFVTRSMKRSPLGSRDGIFLNDTIETMQDGRLVATLEKLTTIRLGAQAKLRIDRFLARKGGTIVIESGAMLFDRPEDAPKTQFEIQSVFAVIAVRGTKFFAGPSKDVYGVFVERGSVKVTAAGKTVEVGAGQGTNIEAPGSPPSDPAPWGKPRIEAAYKSVE